MVEELSAALWWSVWLGLIVAHIAIEAPKWITWQSILSIGMIYLYIWWESLIEIELWRNEIHVVGFDPQTGEGRTHKFFVPTKSKIGLLVRPWQVWSRADFEDPITLNSPAVLTDEWWWYRLWGWVTGERMIRLALKSINNTYTEGQRISPEIVKAIRYVRSTQPKKQEQPKDPTGFLLQEIRLAKLSGELTPEKAQMYTLELLERLIYGI